MKMMVRTPAVLIGSLELAGDKAKQFDGDIPTPLHCSI
jgi:hypothetical protein